MSDLGRLFLETRESSGYEIYEISSALKINKEIIGQLEAGLFYELPSYVYAYGFVKKYAEFLKLDFDEIKDLFDKECVKSGFDSSADNMLPPIEHKPADIRIPTFKIFVALILVAAIAGAVWYVKYANSKSEEILNNQSDVLTETPVDSTPPAVIDNVTVDEKASTPVVQPKDTKPKTEAKPKPKPKVEPKAEKKQTEVKMPDVTPKEVVASLKKEEKKLTYKYNATIEFSDTCWVHINLDDTTHLDFIADPGMKRRINFNDYFVMDMGNAAVVSVVHGRNRISGFGGFRQPAKHLKFSISDNGTIGYVKIK